MHTPTTVPMHGFSLPELLSVLLILSVLLTTGAPALGKALARMHANTCIQGWLHTLQGARNLAIHHAGNTITLCGSPDGIHCSKDWGQGWILFSDANNNHRLDSNEVLHQQGGAVREGTLVWRASAGRPYLRYSPEEFAKEFGTLTWCPPDGDAHLARRITINLPGRPRLERDANGDGIVEDSNGKPLQCLP